MNHVPICQKGEPVLRKTAREIAPELIGGTTLKQEIQQMKDALLPQYEGVAIAAPQIGISKRMFLVSHRVFQDENPLASDMVCINPVITKKSKKTIPMDEGCLSVKDVYGSVRRHTNVTLEYTDESGNRITRGAGGFLAHIFQHEMDHLDGILFIDKAEHTEQLSGKDKKQLELKREQYIKELASKHGK